MSCPPTICPMNSTTSTTRGPSSRGCASRLKRLRDSAIGGDKVSTEFLALTLHRRVQSLADDPTSTLFFGRLDLDHAEHGSERWYVGRRHINDKSR